MTLRTAFVVATATLAFRLPLLHWPFTLNEGGYAYGALWWWKGLTLYGAELWTDRPQGIFVAYLPPVVLAEGSVLAIRAWGALWIAVTALVVAAIAGRVGGNVLATGLAYGLMASSPWVEGWSIDSAMMMTLPTASAILAMLSGRPGLAGAFAGGAALVKMTGLDAIMVAPFFLRTWGARARFVVAGLGVGGIALMHGVLTVGFSDYIYSAVGYRFLHRGVLRADTAYTLASVIWTAPAWLGAALIGTVGVRASPKMAAWFVAAFLGVAAGGHWTWHYFQQIVPPLAVLFGVAVRRGARPAFWRPVGLVVLLWTLGLHVVALAHPTSFQRWWFDAVSVEIGHAVRTATNPGDRVYFAFHGASALYVSGRQSVTPYIYRDQPILVPGALDQLMRDIEAGVPTCVALMSDWAHLPPLPPPTPTPEEFRRIVRKHYPRPVQGPGEIYCR